MTKNTIQMIIYMKVLKQKYIQQKNKKNTFINALEYQN